MKALTQSQYDDFWRDGYLVVTQAVDADLLARLKRDFMAWVDESRAHTSPYGTTINDRPRFDLEPGHSREEPALRRVNAPIEVSESFYEATTNSRLTDCVADLIGPNVKLHHTKINSKLPGAGTQVKWHQDFLFTPHSNDDVVTALLMVDEVTEENGPLEVVPGSHRGELYSLWHDGIFTGAVAEDLAKRCEREAVTCTGPAGSVCFMHTRLLHGSSANVSAMPRTLFICVYASDDAVALSPNPMPSRYDGLMVAGRSRGVVRCIPFDMPLPQLPDSASFFDQQSRQSR